jgi:hypothetical protein
LPETVVCNADLWAACIGGAAEQSEYRAAIEAAGLRVERLEENIHYQFISNRAKRATARYGVKSISVLARCRHPGQRPRAMSPPPAPDRAASGRQSTLGLRRTRAVALLVL